MDYKIGQRVKFLLFGQFIKHGTIIKIRRVLWTTQYGVEYENEDFAWIPDKDMVAVEA